MLPVRPQFFWGQNYLLQEVPNDRGVLVPVKLLLLMRMKGVTLHAGYKSKFCV